MARLKGASFGGLVRFAVGFGCVAVAVVLLVSHAPRVVRDANAGVRSYAYITDPLGRIVTSGDMYGLPRDMQVEALSVIPKGADYALLLPGTVKEASAYHIAPVTYEVAFAWLRYLLLPDRPVDSTDARYVICFGCDTAPWDHHTRWLWKDDEGNSIGRVRT